VLKAKPETRNKKQETKNQKPKTRNQKPEIKTKQSIKRTRKHKESIRPRIDAKGQENPSQFLASIASWNGAYTQVEYCFQTFLRFPHFCTCYRT